MSLGSLVIIENRHSVVKKTLKLLNVIQAAQNLNMGAHLWFMLVE